MICDVKVVLRDYPKRTDMRRDLITVEADSDDAAMALAIEEGKIKWPNAKITPFDVVNKREPLRKTLKAKAT